MAIWYVGLGGSDAQAGTESEPFATVAAANAVVQPGDTVYFLAGTYQNATYGALDAEGNRDVWKESADTIIRINGVHGTEDAPITYAAAPGAHVKLQFDGNGAIVIRDSSYIRIEGFEIEGPGTSVTMQDALDAQWDYRIATSEDAAGDPIYEYRQRDPAETMTTTIADEMRALERAGIDQSGSGKPELFNASAISMPDGSHHIEIVGNNIHHAAAHAVSAHGGNDYITVRGNTISNNTQLTSNGTHAISLKDLDSFGTYDGTTIFIEGNTLIDNYNLLISWVTTKPFVTMAIDEGKSIHVQASLATVDPQTGRVWDHGQILIANNLIVHAGNAAVTVNEARGVDVLNNTIVDAGYINQLIDQDIVPGSPWQGFFSGQGLPADFRVAAGGVRLSGTDDVTFANNLISISDVRLFAIDAAADVTAANTTIAGNIYEGGGGLRIRASADVAELSAGFQPVAEIGFANAANGDYRLLSTSAAVDAGANQIVDPVTGQVTLDLDSIVPTDINGTTRIYGSLDVGAFEFAPGGVPPMLNLEAPTSADRDVSLQGDGFALPTADVTFEVMLSIAPGTTGAMQLVNVTSSNGGQQLLVAVGENGMLEISRGDMRLVSSISINEIADGQPHLISLTFDLGADTGYWKWSTLTGYLDGVSQGSTSGWATAIGGSDQIDLGIGGAWGSDNQVVSGLAFGEVRVFGHVRTPQQIADAAASTLDPATEVGLTGYWTSNGTLLESQIVGVADIVRDEDRLDPLFENVLTSTSPALMGLDASHPLAGSPGPLDDTTLAYWTAYQAAAHIARPGNTWADYAEGLVVTYTFDASQISSSSYTTFDAEYRAVTREVLDLYEQISGLTFVEVTGTTAADISFQNIVGQLGGGGWANYPSAGGGHVSIGYPYEAGDIHPGSYVFDTIVHEVGHAVGLAHPGPYNGSADHETQVDYWSDSSQYTTMSYYGEGYTGGRAGSAGTPLLHDILAVQIEYGANWSTRTGDTIYGYNETTGLDAFDIGTVPDMAIAIWDGGGTDTLDLSGSSTFVAIDMRDGAFSSADGHVRNIAIAYGVVIENAVGSAHNDIIRGNAVGNSITGGDGDDRISGGDWTLPTNAPDPRHFTGIEINAAPLERGQYLGATGISAFSGAAFTIEMMVDLIRIPATIVPFASYAVNGNSNEFLIEGGSDGTLRVIIDGQTRYDTPIPLESLVDGNPHRLSVGWDSVSGTISFFIDGELAHTGNYAAAQGHLIAAGGTLVFGQEQDSVGGTFNTREVLQGTIGDIRIWDSALDQPTIAANAFVTLTGSEAGLLHNWQVQLGDTTTVADVADADPPLNLTDLMPAGTFTVSQSSSYDASSGAERGARQQYEQLQPHPQHRQRVAAARFRSGTRHCLCRGRQPPKLGVLVSMARRSRCSMSRATCSIHPPRSRVRATAPPSPSCCPSCCTPVPSASTRTRTSCISPRSNVFGPPPAGLVFDSALLETNLTIHNGATAVSTAPVIDTTPDNDTLIGGAGRDSLYGGVGNDTLFGDLESGAPVVGGVIAMVRLNQAFDAATMGGGFADHSLDQAQSFPMPATALTFEMMIRLDQSPGANDSVFAYAAGGEWAAQQFTLRGWSDYFDLFIAGQRFDTRIPASAFTGDTPMRLSITWDSASGAVQIFLDGQLADSGTVATGLSLASNGNFWLFSGWDDTIRGDVGDIRIWDHVRAAADIAADALVVLDDPAGETGLVANWQVAGSATLADATGNPAVSALVVQNVTVGNPITFSTADFSGLNDDTLYGGIGNDTLDGGIGRDDMQGGAGNDRYYVDNALDRSIEAIGGGTDTVYASTDYALEAGSEIEYLRAAAGSTGLTLTGNELANTIFSGAGSDTLIGGGGHDIYFVNGLGDRVVELAGGGSDLIFASVDYALQAGSAVEILRANAGAVGITLTGNELANRLDSGAGSDTLSGGLGNDTYYVNGAGDLVLESIGAGFDTVLASVDYTLQAGQEIEYLSANAGSTGLTLTGNELANRLASGAGNDVLVGGLGNDIYYVNGAGDRVVEAGSGGTDTIFASASFTLEAGSAVEYLRANAGSGAITLTGNELSNQLYSGAGNDTLVGGLGNDIYFVNNAADRIVEIAGGGSDLVFTTVGYTLEAGVAVETLRANAGTVGLALTGNELSNRLESGAGADTLAGGGGNDTYYVNGTADLVIEAAGQGSDMVFASVSYTLQAGAEIEYLAANAGSTGLTLTGNELVNRLASGAGNDTLVGGLGNDVYYLNGVGDIVVEVAGGGIDTIYTTANYALGAEAAVEALRANSSAGALVLVGNGFANAIYGAAGNDTLDGRGGNDTLFGGAGDDTFVFAPGLGRDVVLDFSASDLERVDLMLATNITDFEDLVAHHVRETGGVLEIYDGADAIRLNGYSLLDFGIGGGLSSADFLFGLAG